jgi:hypothetical protein
MAATQWAKLLRSTATGWVLLFGVQLLFAAASDFAHVTGIGRVLYPLYVGRDPWTPENLLLNLSLLCAALGAFYFADKFDHAESFDEDVLPWRPERHATRFSQ